MDIEVAAVGGWGEIGRNMTAVRIGDEVILFDMGLHLPNYITLQEEDIGDFKKLTEASLKRAEAVPQDSTIKDWRPAVIAIVISHAHLDHIGAAPYVAAKYDAPIICSPFAADILKTICRDEKIDLPNKITPLKPGQTMHLSKNLKLEFCHVTHSTPQTVIAAVHTKNGLIVYANDYKLDNTPTLGNPPDYERLKKWKEKGVLALIQDCLYSDAERHTPSEQEAKDKLGKVLLESDNKGKGIIVTTFASHTARLKTIAEFAKLINRKPIFMGRSIAKYAYAAKDAKVTDLFKQAQICKYARQIRTRLKEIQHKKDKYLLVVSGHQGEPKSTLNKMINGTYHWNWKDDHVIFSSHIIPAEINRQQRKEMEASLNKLGVKIFKDIHVSGHSSREDLREIIRILKPKHILPTHGEKKQSNSFNTLAEEEGYKLHKNVHPLENGQRIVLD